MKQSAVVCAGDLGAELSALMAGYGPMPSADSAIMLCGNHDHDLAYSGENGLRLTNLSPRVGRVFGDPHQWTQIGLDLTDLCDDTSVPVLVTHSPVPPSAVPLRGYNVHGHLHDNWDRALTQHHAVYPFLATSTSHLNVSVERTGYAPRTLQWLVDAKRAGRLGP
jgi:hypothetical protein